MQICRAAFLHSPVPRRQKRRTRGPRPSRISSQGRARKIPSFRGLFPQKLRGCREGRGFLSTTRELSRLRRLGAERRSCDSPARPRRGHRPGCVARRRDGARGSAASSGAASLGPAPGGPRPAAGPGAASLAPPAPPLLSRALAREAASPSPPRTRCVPMGAPSRLPNNWAPRGPPSCRGRPLLPRKYFCRPISGTWKGGGGARRGQDGYLWALERCRKDTWGS